MYENTYKLAGRVICVRSIHPTVHALFHEYAADGEPDFTVEVTPDDIAFERAVSDRIAKREGRACSDTPDAELETLAVYRLICEQMPAYDTFLFHGSAVSLDGEAYIFAAKSGTGKSTHAALWRKLFGDRAVMVNDDKPLIRISPDDALVCGTPMNGKHRLGANIAVPIKAICILERAAKNSIRRIDKREAFPTLVQQTLRPRGAEALRQTVALLDRLADGVGLYRLYCNMDVEAARVAYDGMNGDTK